MTDHAAIVGIRRDGQIFAPNPDDPLNVGDDAYFITKAEHATRLLEVVGTLDRRARHVVILGAGSIGRYVAEQLEDQSGLRVRVIEADKKTAEAAAASLTRTVILNGDAMNASVQDEAGMNQADVVLALTNDDKTNVLSSILAKKLGAKSAIALLNELSMQELQKEIGLDMVIDPRASTVSSILRHVRRGRILDVYTLSQGQAEVLEGEVMETSTFAGKTLREARINDGVAVGAVVRDGAIMMPEPTLRIIPGDRVILLAENDSLREIEQLFRVGVELY